MNDCALICTFYEKNKEMFVCFLVSLLGRTLDGAEKVEVSGRGRIIFSSLLAAGQVLNPCSVNY